MMTRFEALAAASLCAALLCSADHAVANPVCEVALDCEMTFRVDAEHSAHVSGVASVTRRGDLQRCATIEQPALFIQGTCGDVPVELSLIGEQRGRVIEFDSAPLADGHDAGACQLFGTMRARSSSDESVLIGCGSFKRDVAARGAPPIDFEAELVREISPGAVFSAEYDLWLEHASLVSSSFEMIPAKSNEVAVFIDTEQCEQLSIASACGAGDDRPVCGCDGQRYPDRCALAKSGGSLSPIDARGRSCKPGAVARYTSFGEQARLFVTDLDGSNLCEGSRDLPAKLDDVSMYHDEESIHSIRMRVDPHAVPGDVLAYELTASTADSGDRAKARAAVVTGPLGSDLDECVLRAGAVEFCARFGTCCGGSCDALTCSEQLDSDCDGRFDDEEPADAVTSIDSDGDGLDDFEDARSADPELSDADFDGIGDAEELEAGLDPLDADTDGDGSPDGEDPAPSIADADRDGIPDDVDGAVFSPDVDADSLLDGVDPNTSSQDTDGDGLNDGLEHRLGFDPADATSPEDPTSYMDTDGDGVLDTDEMMFGTSPDLRDSDADALPDGVEIFVHGTDPLRTDSDSDGLPDFAEVNIHYTSPVDADEDLDGVLDVDEVAWGTSSRDGDTDHDGLSDALEIAGGGGSPTRRDTDGGGASDLMEFVFLTDPYDGSDDRLALARRWHQDRLALSFLRQDGSSTTYELEQRPTSEDRHFLSTWSESWDEGGQLVSAMDLLDVDIELESTLPTIVLRGLPEGGRVEAQLSGELLHVIISDSARETVDVIEIGVSLSASMERLGELEALDAELAWGAGVEDGAVFITVGVVGDPVIAGAQVVYFSTRYRAFTEALVADPPPTTETNCGNGIDDDLDGLSDLEDPDCSLAPGPEYCWDGEDNDQDGLIDCMDEDCAVECEKPPLDPDMTDDLGYELCDDGKDNNGDELVDCEDPECEKTELCCDPTRMICGVEVCNDGFDNDYDGLVDCFDHECRYASICNQVIPPRPGLRDRCGCRTVGAPDQHAPYLWLVFLGLIGLTRRRLTAR